MTKKEAHTMIRTINPAHGERLDATLMRATAGTPGLPGVVATLTDRGGELYRGISGVSTPIGAEPGAARPMDADTVLAVLSITKPVAAVAVLQLVEDGRLDLDAPASRYLPVLGEIKVIDGYDADGAPRLRPPRRDITTRMLLLHTAGFAYSNFNHDIKRLEDAGHLPYIGASTKAALMSHLVADPGEAWEYGLGMDWAGQVVEAISGARLGEIMVERIFTPLGMDSTAFTRTDAMTSRLSAIHARLPDGTLTPIDFELPQNPEVEMAGHGLYSTAADFTRFLRMWLNEGQGPHGRILRADTVAEASRNGLGALRVRPLPAANTDVVGAPLDFFPGTSRSWSLGSMVNDEQVHTGRSAGSLSWGGLANSFFWIDPARGVAGFWSTQVLPFLDPTSTAAFLDFETAVYDGLPASTQHSSALTAR